MFSFTLCFILSIANLAYAAIIYMSLHGWIVAHESSGIQLLIHFAITAPITIITSLWYLYLSKNKAPQLMWQINLTGILIPLLSTKASITFYHFHIVGILLAVIISILLTIIYLKTVIKLTSS